MVIIPVSSLPSPIPKLTPLLEISEELDEAEDHQLIMFYRGSFLNLKQVKESNVQSQLSGVDGWVVSAMSQDCTIFLSFFVSFIHSFNN